MAAIDLRKEAAAALTEILDQGGYASLVIDRRLKSLDAKREETLGKDSLPGNEAFETWEREKRFFTSLVYTVIQHQRSIDEMIGRNAKIPMAKMKPMIRALLRIGVAQLLFMDGIKPYAAVSETVNAAKKAGLGSLSPFVNGVLRSVQRNEKADKNDEVTIPVWVRNQIEADYGIERCRQFEKNVASKGALCLRLRDMKDDDTEKIIKTLNGVPGKLIRKAVYVEHLGDISKLDIYREGAVSVQDESSMVAAALVGAKAGDRILDMCAAPGGKSAFMAEVMRNQGEIISRDLHPHRVELIRKGAERIGLSVIRPEQADGTVMQEKDAEAFDRVLLDAPCSGLGILRSKPDIAVNHSEADRAALDEVQIKLLETAAAAVKPGGRLVYSTCTLVKKENEDRIRAFLSIHPEFRLLNIAEGEAGAVNRSCFSKEEADVEEMLTLWPVENGHEGFFVAVMEKRAIQ